MNRNSFHLLREREREREKCVCTSCVSLSCRACFHCQSVLLSISTPFSLTLKYFLFPSSQIFSRLQYQLYLVSFHLFSSIYILYDSCANLLQKIQVPLFALPDTTFILYPSLSLRENFDSSFLTLQIMQLCKFCLFLIILTH